MIADCLDLCFRSVNFMINQRLVTILGSALLLVGCTQQGTDLSSANNWTSSQKLGKVIAEISVAPARVGTNVITVKLDDDNGPVSGASINIGTSMPSMKMDGPDLTAQQISPGTYKVQSDLMQGPWQFDVSIKTPTGKTEKITVETDIVRSVASETDTK